ncbi:MAG: PEGA domain-containing protein [Myxococcales bacterium]|nr:PEGA domain-containing protein [Myxococcales bacterium]
MSTCTTSTSATPPRPTILTILTHLLTLTLTLLTTTLAAQSPANQPPAAPYVYAEGPGADAWVESATARGARAPTTLPPAPPTTPRARVEALARVEAALAEARTHAGRLDEAAAMSALERARRLAEAHADLPNAARWIAEVEVALGLVAWQAGARQLATQSLTRAASLDPERVVRAAEAAPAVARHARELAAEVARAPEARFRVVSTPPGALVELDGAPLGVAPLEVRARRGRHVLRLSLPGHHAFGQVLDIHEGGRAPIEVRLSPTNDERRRARLRAATTLTAAQRALAPGETLEWVQARGERAVAVRCDHAGCEPPRRLVRDRDDVRDEGGPWELAPPIAELSSEEAAARITTHADWLGGDPTGEGPVEDPIPPRPWYRRWPVWTGVALAVAAAAFGIGWALRPAPEQRFRLDLDFGDLVP